MDIQENMGIQSFRKRVRVIKKFVTESIGIIHSFLKNVQDGNVYQTQTMGTFWTDESEETADSTETTSTGITSESEEVDDSSQSISSGDTSENIEGGN